jgi:putative transposase
MNRVNHMKNVDWKIVKHLEHLALDIDPCMHFNPGKYCAILEQKMQQMKSTRHCKYMLNYHVVWCTRGRCRILIPEARALLVQAIQQICLEHGWTSYAIEPMPDHVHLFIGTKDFREKVIGILKGQTSSFLKYCFPLFTKALTDGHLWSSSYYISSIGNISGKTLLKYLAKQWKDMNNQRYEMVLAAFDKGQRTLLSY